MENKYTSDVSEAEDGEDVGKSERPPALFSAPEGINTVSK
jgi:hypothetical protein